MNPIITLVVTVLANAIVTGIIIFLFQKRIEANLQRSMFEHQTKFKMIHEKRTEVLEILYEKFRIFDEAFIDWTRAIRVDKQAGREIEDKLHIERSEYVLGKLNDFWHYFQANRLFLPDNIIDQIWEVYRKAADAEVTVEIISRNPETNLPIGISNEFKGIEAKWGKTEAVFAEMSFVVSNQAMTLEKLYKSVADIAVKQ